MSSFSLAFSVVFPLFGMMALGYGLRCIGLLEPAFLSKLNNLCFKVFLPVLLFVNVYQSDFSTAFSPSLILLAVGCVVATFLLLMLVIPRIEKDNRRRGVLIQGIFRSNFILFGIPVTISLFGQEYASVPSILVAFVVPLFNAFSVVALEVFRDREGRKINPIKIAKGVLKNPLILAALLAFVFVLTGLRLPAVVEKTLGDISKIATPLALIALGGSFAFRKLRGNVGAVCLGVVGKLVLVPLLFLPLCIACGVRGVELCALFSMFASPTAVSSFTMADSMGADSELAGQIVVLGSVAAIVTVFTGILLLRPFFGL